MWRKGVCETSIQVWLVDHPGREGCSLLVQEDKACGTRFTAEAWFEAWRATQTQTLNHKSALKHPRHNKLATSTREDYGRYRHDLQRSYFLQDSDRSWRLPSSAHHSPVPVVNGTAQYVQTGMKPLDQRRMPVFECFEAFKPLLGSTHSGLLVRFCWVCGSLPCLTFQLRWPVRKVHPMNVLNWLWLKVTLLLHSLSFACN